jgi:predicted ATP-binding protein involved in virulence
VADLLFKGITPRRTKVFALGELHNLLGDDLQHGNEVISHLTTHDVLSWSFTELSSGEVAFMMLYANIARALSPLEYTDVGPIFLCLDEGEMFMHPKWQRDYISGVLGFLEKFPDVASKIHLFMSTHSLIVAADTPPNRLFDVLEGRHVNGFGLNPKQTLYEVFHVDNFSGKLSTDRMKSITRCLRDGWKPEELNEARAVAATLADVHLRKYVEQQLGNLGRNANAQN